MPLGVPSSPLPLRHFNSVPRTPTTLRTPILVDDDDLDELAGDTIPCSPGAVLRNDDMTQPTQILSQPRLASSPNSVIEVPASSPFQKPSSRPSALGNRLAPAGTVFRPPPRPQQVSSIPLKRPSPVPIELSSDDDDEIELSRADIKPTTFGARLQKNFAYEPKPYDSAPDDAIRKKLRQVFDVLGREVTPTEVREALDQCEYDVEDTIALLEARLRRSRSIMVKSRATAPKVTTVVSKHASRSPSAAAKPAPRRRLVQGLKKRGTPSPQKPSPQKPEPPSSDDPLIIDLSDNDEGDAYEADDRDSTPEAETIDRVLECMNKSTLKEMAAITGLKETLLEPIIQKRPFTDLEQARRVASKAKPGAKKSSRICIGDQAADAIEVFLSATSTIDKVVTKCEAQANKIKNTLDTWDLDSFGHPRKSGRASPMGDLPPTPTSMNSSRLINPPIPRQPDLMDKGCRMKPFQVFGLNWMSLLHTMNMGCILADEMGLGKTCQVISLMCHLVEAYEAGRERHQKRPWPNLIVVPPSTYNNWLAEFEKFAPELSVIGYRGSQDERAEIAYQVDQDPEAYHVVLATYSQINNEADIEALRALRLHAAIFDEGHKLKNPETKIYKDLQRVTSDWKMLLTGTPVQNNLLEMIALLTFINPEIFQGYVEQIRYIFSHKVSIRDVTNGAFLYSERVQRARSILEPFILQRRKDQVLSDMPNKVCNVVFCDMTDSQKPVYNEYETMFKLEPAQRASSKKSGRTNDQNNVWMQLRKAAVHPLLFRRYFTDETVEEMGRVLMDRVSQDELRQTDIKHLIQELKNESDFTLHLWCRDYPKLLADFDYPPEAELGSGKVVKLLELIKQYQENGDRVLVFSKFSSVLTMLQEVLSVKGIDHRVLMGNTDVSERQIMIDEFNGDPTIPVFLLTTGAGGTGINLTSANKVIIFDQSDNPQDDIQAENRAHRLGQKREVEIIRLISTNTIEELIHKACQKKIELANKVTGAVEDDSEEKTATLESEVRKMMNEQMTPISDK